LGADCQRKRAAKRIVFAHRKFGTASPRVLNEGEAVPKGGGRDHVGRSYTIAGKRYTPYVKPVGYTITGQASWYGPAFHGRKTANGEIYDRHGVSAAHPTMPLPSYARVTNMGNRRSIMVRVNDRGPYHGGRVIDLSQRTADLLEFRHLGTARVRVEYVGRAALRGSDDRMLIASLTTDGSPCGIPGMSQPATMIANAPPLTSPRVMPADRTACPGCYRCADIGVQRTFPDGAAAVQAGSRVARCNQRDRACRRGCAAASRASI
jgi:rare lipoprotein A